MLRLVVRFEKTGTTTRSAEHDDRAQTYQEENRKDSGRIVMEDMFCEEVLDGMRADPHPSVVTDLAQHRLDFQILVEESDNTSDGDKHSLRREKHEQEVTTIAATAPSPSAFVFMYVESAIELILVVASRAVCHGLWVVILTVIAPLIEATSMYIAH